MAMLIVGYLLVCWLIPVLYPVLLPEEGYTTGGCILAAHICSLVAIVVVFVPFLLALGVGSCLK